MTSLYCIGDSHAFTFSGAEKMIPTNVWVEHPHYSIRTIRIGSYIAYNLRTKVAHILQVLQTVPIGSNILFCFGEIDCRVHLKFRSEQENRVIEDIVKECVSRYLAVAVAIQSLGYNTGVWAVAPPNGRHFCKDLPSYGTQQERMEIVQLFNMTTKQFCRELNIKFISIFDELLAELETRIVGDNNVSNEQMSSKYFYDSVHLRPTTVMPLIIPKLEAAGIAICY